jgi:hypothetical protein
VLGLAEPEESRSQPCAIPGGRSAAHAIVYISDSRSRVPRRDPRSKLCATYLYTHVQASRGAGCASAWPPSPWPLAGGAARGAGRLRCVRSPRTIANRSLLTSSHHSPAFRAGRAAASAWLSDPVRAQVTPSAAKCGSRQHRSGSEHPAPPVTNGSALRVRVGKGRRQRSGARRGLAGERGAHAHDPRGSRVASPWRRRLSALGGGSRWRKAFVGSTQTKPLVRHLIRVDATIAEGSSTGRVTPISVSSGQLEHSASDAEHSRPVL